MSYVLAWFAVMALPRLDWRWRAVRAIARTALAAAGVPLAVAGIERVPRGNAMLVFNHSSYMDVVVLAAALPGEPAYVAKKDLARQFFAGPFLRRLGTLFVERHAMLESLADTEVVVGAARQGRILVFFPEGTFTRRAGLSDFYLGAFKVAAEAGLPVLPGIRARNAIDAARRAMVSALGAAQRRDRGARSSLPERTSRRWCNCAMRCARWCWRTAASPISGSW